MPKKESTTNCSQSFPILPIYRIRCHSIQVQKLLICMTKMYSINVWWSVLRYDDWLTFHFCKIFKYSLSIPVLSNGFRWNTSLIYRNSSLSHIVKRIVDMKLIYTRTHLILFRIWNKFEILGTTNNEWNPILIQLLLFSSEGNKNLFKVLQLRWQGLNIGMLFIFSIQPRILVHILKINGFADTINTHHVPLG